MRGGSQWMEGRSERELDFEKGTGRGTKENWEGRELVENFHEFWLVDWCFWDFGLRGQEI